ncbi:unnamed protein product [Spirodela intermedia]|uniref:Uncharacterized protein n=1 Tax=Spirodela intermedia TaxID=51605 RepID=A0A7I8K6G2_SPIIN|nr:unnamed protein product [Spirodela intermedia]
MEIKLKVGKQSSGITTAMRRRYTGILTFGRTVVHGKTATLQLSGDCHPTERRAGWRWGACQGASSSGPRSKRRLFIASPKPLESLLAATPDCASDPLAGPNKSPLLEL